MNIYAGNIRLNRIKKTFAFIFLCLLAVLSQTAFSIDESLNFDNQKQERLYQLLIQELRCLVCQNQNIADSNADLAKDLREQTYTMVKAGKSEAHIKQYMRDRFGDFVLYSPPIERKTWLLWIGPALILFCALFFVTRLVLRNAKEVNNSNNDHESL